MNGMQMLKKADELVRFADSKFQKREYSEAEIFYLQALGLRECALGSRSGLVQDILEKLQLTYEADQRFDEAERVRQRMNVPPMAA